MFRAVLSRGGKSVDLTEDHKPNAPREMERIYRFGGLANLARELVCFFNCVACAAPAVTPWIKRIKKQ